MTRLGKLALMALLVLLPDRAPAQTPQKFAFRAVHYDVTAALNPAEQMLTARARVEFQAVEASRQLDVELHPNLKISAVVSGDGKAENYERDPNHPLVVRITLPQPAAVGQKVTLLFEYAGPLANEENSPVKGVRLASINQDGAYLLLPARWFPLTDYPSNRYTAVFNLEVPQNFAVVGTGKASAPNLMPEKPSAPAGKAAREAKTGPHILYTFRAERPAPVGTFVAGNIQLAPVSSEGLNISVYVRAADMKSAAAYGDSLAHIVNFFSEQFGHLPEPHLALAQLPEGTVPGYSAPGLLLVSVRRWDPQVNYRILAQLAA